MAETTAGTWRLDLAIASHWDSEGLNEAFRREWLDPVATEYQPLNDGEARPAPPGPYCVYQKNEPSTIVRMSGDEADATKEVQRWPVSFTIHCKSTATETGKEIARRLAVKVAAAFDPHKALQIEDALYVTTLRGPDWHDREGDEEWSWTLEYEFIVDVELKSQLVSTPTPPPPEDTDEVDDVLDFGDIGGHYGDESLAAANTAALNTYLATRGDKAVALKFRGPTTYNDEKREPMDAYLDISSTIPINVGGSGQITDLVFEGPSKIIGVNAGAATTPIFTITRAAGTMPVLVFKNMIFESDGSVIKIVNGGSGVSLENVKITDFTGSGAIDHEAWTDVAAETFSYGIFLDNADGTRLQSIQIKQGSGHGIVAKRLHAGEVQCRIQHCDGAGVKVERCNGTRASFWVEHCEGYGLHCRDTGVNRYSGGAKVANDGAPNEWECWFEGNNGRSTSYSALGYTFSQFKFDNVARVRMTGHSGWRQNQCRVERFDRVRNEQIEQRHTTVSESAALELVSNYQVTGDVELPDATNSNWSTVWTDAGYRPTAAIVGAGTENDPERIRVTWPADSFDNTDALITAYWRMFNTAALSSPATFYWEADVEDVDGNIAAYCAAREAASNRQLNVCGGFAVDPVAGSLTGFPLWDQNRRQFSGEIEIEDTRTDIQPSFSAFMSGMQDQEGNAPQDVQHVMDIYQVRIYRLI